MYAAGAWHNMNLHTVQAFSSQMLQQLRFLIPHIQPGPGIHNLDIVAHCQCEHPLLMLAVSRFSLFDRVMQTEMTELFALLQASKQKGNWLEQVRQDVQFARQITDDPALAQVADTNSFQQLAMFCVQNPKALTKFGKRAVKTFKAYCRVWLTYTQFEKDFEADVCTFGIRRSYQEAAPVVPQQWTCTVCSIVFPTFKALCSHAYQKHNITNVAQQYCSSTVCRGCLKVYDSRQQVVHHLKYYRTGCLLQLLLTETPLSAEELQTALDESKAAQPVHKNQQRRTRHKWPVQQAHGPLRPWPWQRSNQFAMCDTRSIEPMSPQCFSDWIVDIIQPCLAGDVETVLSVLSKQPYTGELAHRITQWVVNASEVSTLDASAVDMHLVIQEAIQLWQDNHLLPRCNPCLPIPRSHVLTAMTALRATPVADSQADASRPQSDTRSQRLAEMWNVYDIPLQLSRRVEREHQKQYAMETPLRSSPTAMPICLYVFSGRRRKGDFQEYVEFHLQSHQCRGQVLLLDLALDDSHDVGNSQLVNTLLHWIRCKAVAGVLLAPPCETWTEARYNRVHDDDPRPLRSATFPLSLPQLHHGEVQQLQVSNLLLFVGLRILFHACMTGTPAIMEHPAEPVRPERPSIWKLPWTRMMEQHKLLSRVRVWQAYYGGVSMKPTDLAYCHVEGFDAHMYDGRERIQWKSLITLQGRTAQGQWRTSQAKEYPAKMNSLLAESFVLANCSTHGEETASPAPLPIQIQTEFDRLYAGHVDQAQQEIKPDYNVKFQRSKDLTHLD